VEKDPESPPRTAGPAITNNRYITEGKTDYIPPKLALFLGSLDTHGTCISPSETFFN
jgi:hypothetical protein